jgi:hypothetical protein
MTHDAMAQVAAQREQLAERARLPWWFWALFTIATIGLLGGALFARALPGDVSVYVVTWPSVLVYLLADRLVRWRRGISLSTTTMRDYPSSRAAGIGFVLVAAVVVVAVGWLARHDVLVWAAVVAGVGTCLAVGAMVAVQRGMRADIRHGRARAA